MDNRQDGECWQLAIIGILPLSQRDVPRDFAQYATVGEVEAESLQNPPNLENQFLHRLMCYSRTVALRWPIVKQKKRVCDN
jgi:hypothetical protein